MCPHCWNLLLASNLFNTTSTSVPHAKSLEKPSRKAAGEAAASAKGVPESKHGVTSETREDAAFFQRSTGEGAVFLASAILEDLARSSTGATGPTTQQGELPSSLTSIVAMCRRSGSKAVISSCAGPKAPPFVETNTRSFEASAVETGRMSTGAPAALSEEGGGSRATAAARDGGVSPASGSDRLVGAVLKSLALLVGADTVHGAPPANTAEIRIFSFLGDPGNEVRSRVDNHKTDRLLIWKAPTSIGKAGDGIGPRAVPSEHRGSLSPPLSLVPPDSDTTPPAAGVEAVDMVHLSHGAGGRTGENAQVDTDGRRRLLFRGVLRLLEELFKDENQVRCTEDGRKGESRRGARAGAGCRLQASGQQGKNGIWVSEGARRYPLAVFVISWACGTRRLLGARSSSFPRPLQPAPTLRRRILHTIQTPSDLGRLFSNRCDGARPLRIFPFSQKVPISCWVTTLMTRPGHVGESERQTFSKIHLACECAFVVSQLAKNLVIVYNLVHGPHSLYLRNSWPLPFRGFPPPSPVRNWAGCLGVPSRMTKTTYSSCSCRASSSRFSATAGPRYARWGLPMRER